MTKQDQEFMNEQKPTSYTRVPVSKRFLCLKNDLITDTKKPPFSFFCTKMEPLYERLLKKPFPDSVSAIEYCRSVCAEFGFTVKQEASANRVK